MKTTSVSKQRVGKPWSAAELKRLRDLYPRMRTGLIEIPGRTRAQIHSQAGNLHLKKSAAFLASADARKCWTAEDRRQLRALYPDKSTQEVAAVMHRSLSSIYGAAATLGLSKSAQYLASPAAFRFRRGYHLGWEHRFPKGHVPFNKGIKGWQSGGRSVETQFKKGGFPVNRDPDYYVPGALRVNSDGYIDMRVSFEPGARGWRGLHLVLWEDAHGPVPKGHCLRFKDGDKLNVEIDNLVLISRADNCRRNSIHNLPAPLRDTIQLLGQLKRRINEKQNRGSAQSPVRDARGSA